MFFVLAGCAAVTPPDSLGDFWVMGKVGVRDGGENHSARFSWRQDGPRYEIGLWGPLGQGRTQLKGDAGYLEIVDGSGAPVLAGHPETVMHEHLSWSLPLDVLPFWMQGEPSPGSAVEDVLEDAGGRLVGFKQLGWQVSYDRYQAYGTTELPNRITAEKPGYRVRVVVSERQIRGLSTGA